VSNRREQQLVFVLAQPWFDIADPINYIDMLSGSANKNCLWQCAVGDLLAPWFGCDMLMRTGGFPQAAPVIDEIYGVDTIDTPTEAGTSALQYFDPQLGVSPLANNAIEDNGAHKALRRNDEVHFQIMDYVDPSAPGTVVNHCDGPCIIDPEPLPEE